MFHHQIIWDFSGKCIETSGLTAAEKSNIWAAMVSVKFHDSFRLSEKYFQEFEEVD